MSDDYNNGAWHGWNGGECPVHPKSNIIYVYQSTATAETGLCHIAEDIAANVSWYAAIAFRVIKEHREPREFWAVGRHLHDTEADAAAFRQLCADQHGDHHLRTPIIRVREVIE